MCWLIKLWLFKANITHRKKRLCPLNTWLCLDFVVFLVIAEKSSCQSTRPAFAFSAACDSRLRDESWHGQCSSNKDGWECRAKRPETRKAVATCWTSRTRVTNSHTHTDTHAQAIFNVCSLRIQNCKILHILMEWLLQVFLWKLSSSQMKKTLLMLRIKPIYCYLLQPPRRHWPFTLHDGNCAVSGCFKNVRTELNSLQ